ncbi:MAG TPA: hypothetical protein VGR00_15100, partial [Thermoanaerobaculia bacterium]|nr:hypothetical protein [Thermoanaerobaculia bacterium]
MESSRFLAGFATRRKAELHLHLEGSVAPATLVALSRRNESGRFSSREAVLSRRAFSGFRDFLDLYRDVCRELRGPADYALLARDLVRRLRRERIVHAEVYVSPALVERFGFSWPGVAEAIENVFARHERGGFGTIRVLYDSVRQWGPETAHRVLDLAERHPWPRAVGFGLGGDE